MPNKDFLKPRVKTTKTKKNWDPSSDDFSGPWATKAELEEENNLSSITEQERNVLKQKEEKKQ